MSGQIPTQLQLEAFIIAIRSDASMTPTLRIALGGLLPILQLSVPNTTLLQQAWSDAIAVYGSSWLTSTVQTMILGYATTYHIPLVT